MDLTRQSRKDNRPRDQPKLDDNVTGASSPYRPPSHERRGSSLGTGEAVDFAAGIEIKFTRPDPVVVFRQSKPVHRLDMGDGEAR